MPTSFSHIVLRLFTFPLLLLQLLQKRKNYYLYFCHRYLYYHTTLLLNTLLQILSCPGVVELTTQLLILKNVLWLPLCRINKFGLYFTLESCCDRLHLWVIKYLCTMAAKSAKCAMSWRLMALRIPLSVQLLQKNEIASSSRRVTCR